MREDFCDSALQSEIGREKLENGWKPENNNARFGRALKVAYLQGFL